jgi:hypothetical protein
MTEYTCYEVKGFYNRGYEVIEHNLLEVLKKTNYRAYTTKDFFNRRFLSSACIETVYYGNNYKPNMVYIQEKIARDKLVIFPVSSVIFMDEVFRYLEMGFIVWFMKAKDYKQFKKDYAMSM